MALTDWTVIRPPAAGESCMIIAVDFESSRTELGFREMSMLMDIPYGIVQPTAAAIPPTSDGREFIGSWADELRAAGTEVRAVLGYCASGALACGLAAELERDGPRPAVFIVDPQSPSRPMAYYQFVLAIRQFGAAVGPAAIDAAQKSALEACRNPDVNEMAAALPALYRELAESALADLDDEEVVDEICAHFSSYLRYLLAAIDLGFADSRETDSAAFSTEYQPPEDFRGSVIQFQLDHHALLADPGLAEAAQSTIIKHLEGHG